MATVYKEVISSASAEAAWDAMRDVGALHTRLVPGFVTSTELVPGGRRVTFANGMVVEEPIIGIDDNLRRLVWTSVGSSGVTHYNAAAQVYPREAGGSRVVWTADILPHEAARSVEQMMDQGAIAMTRALNAVAS